jgi:hypothetical protein
MEASAEIFKQSVEARNRAGIGLSHRPAKARIYKLLRSPRIDSKKPFPLGRYYKPIPTRFLALINCLEIPAQATQPGIIGSFESIIGLLKVYKFGLWVSLQLIIQTVHILQLDGVVID